MVSQKYLIAGPIVGIVVCLDQLVKFTVTTGIPENSHIGLLSGTLRVAAVQSPGLSFRFLADFSSSLQGVLTLALPTALVALCVVFLIRARGDDRNAALAYSLVGGALLSNHIDRWRLGSVTEVFELKPFGFDFIPFFNTADLIFVLGLVLGVLLLATRNTDSED